MKKNKNSVFEEIKREFIDDRSNEIKTYSDLEKNIIAGLDKVSGSELYELKLKAQVIIDYNSSKNIGSFASLLMSLISVVLTVVVNVIFKEQVAFCIIVSLMLLVVAYWFVNKVIDEQKGAYTDVTCYKFKLHCIEKYEKQKIKSNKK